MFGVYFDLTLHKEPEIPLWDRMGRLLRITHVGSKDTQTPFAIAFPGWMREGYTLGDTMRVFVEDENGAVAICESIEAAPGMRDLAIGSRIKKADGSGELEAYLMHRISSGASKGGKIPYEEKVAYQEQARARRIAEQEALKLPFLRMRSSSGNGFRLVIERIKVGALTQALPNGYGLSRATQVVALPVVK